MADNNIRFTIGSTFSGEGFKKAQQAVKSVNDDVKKATATASQLAGAFGGMDVAATKNIQAMTGLAQAILSFNATTIATQVALVAINRYFGEMKEAAEAAKKKADELHASMEKAFSNAMTGRMTAFNSEVKAISDDFERITRQANQFAAALEGVRGAEAKGGVLQLQVEKLNALLEAHGDEQRANIEAAYNLKIAIQKSADSQVEWKAKIDAANQAVVDAEKRVGVVDEQIVKIGEERKSLEETMLAAKASGDKHWLDIQKQVTALWEQEQGLEKNKLELESQIDVLRLKEKQVKAEANNAQSQATAEILQAELADKKLTEAKHARAVKETAAKEAAELKAASDAKETKEVVDAAEVQRKANKAAKDLAAAEKIYAETLSKYNTPGNLITDAARALVDKQMPGGLLPVNVQKGIQLTVADRAVDDAIRNGTIRTVKDADKLQRQAMRETRNEISKQQRQQLAEAKKYKRLQEMNPKTLCSADKAFMQKYEKLQKAQEERKKQVDDAKKAVEEAKKHQKKAADDLDAIVKMMKGFGLK